MAQQSQKMRQIKCQRGQVIEFPQQFEQVCAQFNNANTNEDFELENISYETLKVIKEFYESHDWKDSNVKVNMPLQSDKLKDEIDENSFKILEPYSGIERINKITPLIDAAYYLNLEGFKQACQAALAFEFIIGPTDEDIKQFKEKHNIMITKEEEEEYGKEFEEMFKELNEKKLKEMQDKQAQQ